MKKINQVYKPNLIQKTFRTTAASGGAVSNAENAENPGKVEIRPQLKRIARAVWGSIVLMGLAAGCATSSRTKTLTLMAGAGAIGALHGSGRPEYPKQNSALFAATGAAAGAVIGLFLFDQDKERAQLALEIQQLRQQIEVIHSPREIAQGPATFGAKIPEKYRSLIQPGQWRLSEIDQWVEEGENRLVHQSLLMELIPPTLTPSMGALKSSQTSKGKE